MLPPDSNFKRPLSVPKSAIVENECELHISLSRCVTGHGAPDVRSTTQQSCDYQRVTRIPSWRLWSSRSGPDIGLPSMKAATPSHFLPDCQFTILELLKLCTVSPAWLLISRKLLSSPLGSFSPLVILCGFFSLIFAELRPGTPALMRTAKSIPHLQRCPDPMMMMQCNVQVVTHQ